MGIYSDYLDRQMGFQDLAAERKRQLHEISRHRGGRDVLVFAADLNKGRAPVSITFADLLPFSDQLENLNNHTQGLDLILETPGGAGEVAEDLIRIVRSKYSDLAVIVAGYAKSAGTIMAMAADDILMGPASALGPIDAQLFWQGKVFSADALLKGMEKIKKEVEATGTLNRAYIPILQAISPGELESAENALKFAEVLVTEWLARYKFKNWATRSSGKPVTDKMRRARAKKIARKLCDHGHWLTHGRSLKVEDLENLQLRITDYSKDAALDEAIRRYYTLLQMTFATNCYKVFETTESQIYRFLAPAAPPPQQQTPEMATIEVECGRCGVKSRVQANLGKSQPLQPGAVAFPADNKFKCPDCGAESDLGDLRRQIEGQTGKRVVK